MSEDIGRSRRDGLGAPEGAEPCGLGATPAIPNAALKYQFFTPYHRGFDLVFDFLCSQPERRFSSGLWSITSAYGYERSRDVKVFADEQYVGTAHSLNDRFAPIAPAYQDFMKAVETAATEWAADKRAAKDAEAQQFKTADAALCERVLSAHAKEHRP